MQKLRIQRQSSRIRSSAVNLGHPVIKRPPIRNICKSKTRNRGNSKLLGRIVVTVFNVPFPYIYHFPKKIQNLWSRAICRPTTQFIKFELVPVYLELSFYSICKISSMFDDKAWSKIIFKIHFFLHLLKSVNNKHTLVELVSIQNVHRHPPRVRLHSGRETWLSTTEKTSASKQDAVITQKYKKDKNKKAR